VGRYCPEIILKKVVFPAPFGPIIDLKVKGKIWTFT
jgi:hypothetical protein